MVQSLHNLTSLRSIPRQIITNVVNAVDTIATIKISMVRSLSLMILLFLSFSMTSWAQIDPSAMADVSLTVTSNQSEIFIGENVTYTVKVQNDAHTSVTGLQVKLLDILPPGSSYVSKTAAAGTSYAQATGIWTIGSALTASTSSLTMTLTVKAVSDGILFARAEVSAMNEADYDSTPNNALLDEDDIGVACTSVPIFLHCGGNPDTITIKAPTGYAGYKWFNNGVEIPGEILPELVVFDEGSFTFEINDPAYDCEISLCCPVAVYNCFDLAIRKTLVSPNHPVTIGEEVTFNIRIFNQGNIDATNIDVVDYLPPNFALSPLDANGWTAGPGAGQVKNRITSTLASEDSTNLSIVLRVQPGITTQTYINRTEIYYAEDTNGKSYAVPGGDRTESDYDSHPDATNGNDNEIDNVISGDVKTNPALNQDEDDADLAGVPVQVFDLALIKYLDPPLNQVSIGDTVTFLVKVQNQGTMDAQNITVQDVVPSGFTYQTTLNPGWLPNINGSNILNYTIADLNAGLSTTLSLKLIVNNTAGMSNGDLTNTAEIKEAWNDYGLKPIDEDSSPDGNHLNDMVTDRTESGDIDESEDPNFPGDEDDHDIATVSPGTFDLSLVKLLSSSGPFTAGDVVAYSILVKNQGTVDGYNIKITDYIPSGLQFNPALNPGWTGALNAAAPTYNVGSLTSGQMTTATINLIIRTTAGIFPNDLVNAAEIYSATNVNGVMLMDEDSSPDQSPLNDPTDDRLSASDIDIDDDRPNDEDDHDIAVIELGTFDLALTKLVSQDTVQFGQVVTFTLNVANQGDLEATSISVVDYVPAGLTFDPAFPNNTGWTGSLGATKPTYLITDLVAGEDTMILIDLMVNAMATNTNITNASEIRSALNENGLAVDDEDSTPDNVDGDDVIDRKGANDHITIDFEVGDEDDHDIAVLVLETFDLALIKTLAAGESAQVAPGQIVTFTITVTNQGDIPADQIEITDYIPSDMTFVPSGNWVLNGDSATVVLSVAGGDLSTGGLTSGNSVTVDIQLMVNTNATPQTEITNWAEISAATDENGDAVIDIDSDPDGLDNNDIFLLDNFVNGNGKNGGDEDDHDPASVTVLGFDLALYKVLALDRMPVSPVVTWSTLTSLLSIRA
ncbi:MAG: DUF11 domain-containing protein [Saprospiraceae bacterium]|nr:DUF11 domain-containing protein [Saprospiraceae bacterium]